MFTFPNITIRTICLPILFWSMLYPSLGCLFAQTNLGDSLSVQIYQDKFKAFKKTNVDSAFYYSDLLVQFATQNKQPELQIESLLSKAELALIERRFGRLKITLEAIDLAIAQNRKILKENANTYTNQKRPLHFLSEVLLDNQKKAIKLLNQYIYDLEQIDSRTEDENLTLSQYYFNLGVLHKNIGNYSKALEYYFTGQKFQEGRKVRYEYIADLYWSMGDTKNAKKYFLLSLQDETKDRPLIISDYQGLTKIYLIEDSTNQAIATLDRSMNFHIEDDPFLPSTYNLYGKAYAQKQAFPEARAYVQKAFKELKKSIKTSKNHQYGDVYLNWGNIHQQEGNLKQALEKYQLAIANLVPDLGDKNDFRKNPSIANVYFKIQLLEALATKSKALYQLSQEDQQQEDWLGLSKSTALLGIQLIDSIRSGFTSEQDKQILIEQSYSLYEQAIEIAYQSKAYDEALALSEGSRAIVLAEALQSRRASLLAEVHPDTLYQLKQLREQLSETSKALSEVVKEDSIKLLRQSLFQVKDQYQKMMGLVSKDAKYQQALQQQQRFSIQEIRKQMASKDALLEFFVGEKHIYAFLLQKKDKATIQAQRIERSPALNSAILSINQYITNERDEAYLQAAQLIYRALFEPLFAQSPPESLTIIPDGPLGYIPFNALLTKEVEVDKANHYADHPYLFKKTQISLAFSASTLLQQEQNGTSKQAAQILVYTPSFKNTASSKEVFNPLIFSSTEAQFLAKKFGAQVISDSLATSPHFMEYAPKASIIHLSTHGQVNRENPDLSFVAFSNFEEDQNQHFKLTVSDIYAQNLPCDMVVLSACETGVGKALRGEGIISIARAFAYAGANSVVTSLWKVNDQKTAELVKYFYQQLHQKKGKDGALQQAMFDYLANEQIDLNQKSPKYWAAFTVIGDTSPIEFRKGSTPILYFLGVVLLGLLVLVFWRNKKNSQTF